MNALHCGTDCSETNDNIRSFFSNFCIYPVKESIPCSGELNWVVYLKNCLQGFATNFGLLVSVIDKKV